ncbi:LLM class flavin-dependent oxidoreductase [Pseudonocardia sp.]|uniref:LLM class flavin-dependent oxidoreductase n=1 Tax=Pseudonocardia sp. TaxID=60912 RepID=UPI003D0F1B97
MRIYTTCPPSKGISGTDYLPMVRDIARWSDRAGCEGILVYTDNGLVDPWLVSQVIIQATRRLCPLVAVQPVYMHPYAVAKMVASLAHLHGRAVHLNMLAGGFRNDLIALGDDTEHDERYRRTVEYTRIVMALLRDEGPVTVDGQYYTVKGLRLRPKVPAELLPDVLVSGSSPAGREAARALDATAVKYPQPPGQEIEWMTDGLTGGFGIRVGIVARDTTDEAWRVAHERFPTDRSGQITHRLAMAVSDSHWHGQLSGDEHAGPDLDGEPDPYWLGPFQNYRTFCPYLVGSYDRVARMLSHYMDLGTSTFILDVPPSEEELAHCAVVFAKAQEMVTT